MTESSPESYLLKAPVGAPVWLAKSLKLIGLGFVALVSRKLSIADCKAELLTTVKSATIATAISMRVWFCEGDARSVPLKPILTSEIVSVFLVETSCQRLPSISAFSVLVPMAPLFHPSLVSVGNSPNNVS